jgi:hypothetical protein
MSGIVMRVVIEPPSDHENQHLVSGERIEALVILEDHSPWHRPWTGWKITQVLSEVEVQE